MKDFQALVKRMRDAQKAYFRNRTKDNLERAKQLEKEVDSALEPNLFEQKK